MRYNPHWSGISKRDRMEVLRGAAQGLIKNGDFMSAFWLRNSIRLLQNKPPLREVTRNRYEKKHQAALEAARRTST